MTEIVEQRIKSTVIRRRAKKEETPPPAAEQPKVEEVAQPEEAVHQAVEVTAEPSMKPAPEPVESRPVEVAASAPVEPVAPAPEVQKHEPHAAKPQPEQPKQDAKPAAPEAPKVERFRPRIIFDAPKPQTRIISQPKPGEVTGRAAHSTRPSVPITRPGTYGAPPRSPATSTSATGLLRATPAATQALEDKFKKAPKKKLSKAEMDFEEIQRVGGLKHYIPAELLPEQVDAIARQRVFEPGPRRVKRVVKREFQKTQITEMKASKKVIKVAEAISVSELSQSLGVKSAEIIKRLMALGTMVTVNQSIDADCAELIAKEYGFEIDRTAFKEEAVFEEVSKERSKNATQRPPVVTVMGHVDHGKTSVLDYIRKAKVAAGEAGGITQHVGAYEVKTAKGTITFIDTPGHAAFTAMRARGAKVTDIVVLVVAADDGVMPQTKEAIDHAKGAGVPIIVAINKIDKPEANIDRCKRSLSENGIFVEDWGGDVICVGTSAKTGQGIDQLLDMILLQAEVMELKADAGAAVKGTIIEAKLDRGLGPVATVLVQQGTLKQGMAVVCGLNFGKARALIDPLGQQVEEAGPSKPVTIIGLSGVPLAGDELMEVADEKTAREVAERRQMKARQDALSKNVKVSLEDFHKQLATGDVKELGVVLKADVHGSVEAIKEALVKQSTEKVKVKVLHAGVGGVTESDVMLASASNGLIVGFNVVPETGVSSIAEREGVEIRRYSIIYELMDDVKKAMEGLLAPIQVEKIIGHAQVRQVFNISGHGVIAGCAVADGMMQRNANVRLIRDNKIIYTGKLESLKRFKDDAKEVKEGNECGLSFGYNDIKEGDTVEAFVIEQIAQTL